MASVFKGMSFENMSRQSGRLFADLTNAYAQLRSTGKFNTEDVKRVGFTEIIRAHTGMQCDVTITTKFPLAAFIALPPIDKNHPFVQQYARERFAGSEVGEVIVALRNNPKGTVDTQSGMVGGLFSEVPVTVNMGSALVTKAEFTAEELAAITLHELGHAYTYFLHLGTSVTSALMAGSIARCVMGAETYGERLKTIQQAERVLGVEMPGKSRISEMTPVAASRLVTTVVLRHEVEYMQSQMGTPLYEARACEQLADEFAVKHGAGAPLATALAKLGKRYLDKAYWNPAIYVIFESIKVAFYLVRACILATYNWLTKVYLVIDIMAFFLNAPALQVYDAPKDRAKMILQRLIETLKDPSLSEEIVHQVREDISVVREVVEDTHYHPDVFEFVWHLVHPTGRKRVREEDFNKRLEEMIFNDLFEHAASFRVAKTN